MGRPGKGFEGVNFLRGVGMAKLTQKSAADLVLAMRALLASLKSIGVEDAEETRLVEALEEALRWGYIVHVAEGE